MGAVCAGGCCWPNMAAAAAIPAAKPSWKPSAGVPAARPACWPLSAGKVPTGAGSQEGWSKPRRRCAVTLPLTAAPSWTPLAKPEAPAGSAPGAGPALKSARESTPGGAAASQLAAPQGEAGKGLGEESEEAASAAQGAALGPRWEGVSGSDSAQLARSCREAVGGTAGPAGRYGSTPTRLLYASAVRSERMQLTRRQGQLEGGS